MNTSIKKLFFSLNFSKSYKTPFMKHVQLTFSLFLLFITYLSAQPGDLPDDTEPGKCYAKCLIASAYDIYEEEFPIYIGDEPKKIDFDTIEVTIPGEKKWEKRKADRNCLSNNPEDCLVWSLVKDVPDEIITIVYMLNPSQSDMVDWEVYKIKEMTEEGDVTEWREVICTNHITPVIVQQIQETLKKEGYYQGKVIIINPFENEKSAAKKSILSVQTKAALTQYQKHNGLPIGNLDVETLDALGIEW